MVVHVFNDSASYDFSLPLTLHSSEMLKVVRLSNKTSKESFPAVSSNEALKQIYTKEWNRIQDRLTYQLLCSCLRKIKVVFRITMPSYFSNSESYTPGRLSIFVLVFIPDF